MRKLETILVKCLSVTDAPPTAAETPPIEVGAPPTTAGAAHIVQH